MDTMIKVRANGQVTIPRKLRDEFHIGEGDLVKIEATPDGLLVRPQRMIDASQAWFWTEEWQEGEKRASEDIKKGRTTKFETTEEFLEFLSNLDEDQNVPTWEALGQFIRDYKKLTSAEKNAFNKTVEKFVHDLIGRKFRKGLRIKKVQGPGHIYEITWAPDGRATFEFGEEQIENEVHIIWRRIGGHDIFGQP